MKYIECVSDVGGTSYCALYSDLLVAGYLISDRNVWRVVGFLLLNLRIFPAFGGYFGCTRGIKVSNRNFKRYQSNLKRFRTFQCN